MKIIIAPDKLKGSLTSVNFCKSVKSGLKKKFPDAKILQFPLADGGEGLVEILHYYLKGKLVTINVSDPLFRKIKAQYGISENGRTAYIEMATASGLYLLKKEEQNCFYTTTYGTGELILHAIEQGVEEIILGIGGSATNDAGIGMATALGYKFFDENNKEIIPIGRNLNNIAFIDDSQLKFDKSEITIKVACDVSNPLYGKKGAAFVYAKQKGASNEQIIELDKGLKHFAEKTIKKFHIPNLANIPGVGAAGGMGAAGIVFLNAKLISGIELIIDKSQLKKHIVKTDLIITGEGKMDSQTIYGKAISGISNLAKKYNIPVIGICGICTLTPKEEEELGLKKVYQIIKKAKNYEDAIKNASIYVREIASDIEM